MKKMLTMSLLTTLLTGSIVHAQIWVKNNIDRDIFVNPVMEKRIIGGKEVAVPKIVDGKVVTKNEIPDNEIFFRYDWAGKIPAWFGGPWVENDGFMVGANETVTRNTEVGNIKTRYRIWKKKSPGVAAPDRFADLDESQYRGDWEKVLDRNTVAAGNRFVEITVDPRWEVATDAAGAPLKNAAGEPIMEKKLKWTIYDRLQ